MTAYSKYGMLVILCLALSAIGALLIVVASLLLEEDASLLSSPYFLSGLALGLVAGMIMLFAFYMRKQIAESVRPPPKYIDVMFFNESGRLR